MLTDIVVSKSIVDVDIELDRGQYSMEQDREPGPWEPCSYPRIGE